MPVRFILNLPPGPFNHVGYELTHDTLTISDTYLPGSVLMVQDNDTITASLNGTVVATATYHFTNSTAATISPTIDSNGNGLPDAWELAFNITNPAADADGDGVSNLNEFLAGTDPNNINSTPNNPRIPPMEITMNPAAGQVILEWDARSGPMLLESSADLGDWTGTKVTPGQTTCVEPAINRAFYRLRPLPTVQQ
jgi:hypothetical protein